MEIARNARHWCKNGRVALGFVLLSVLVPRVAAGQLVAPDATERGPLATTSAEYRFPAAVDPDVLDATPPRAVEIWARMYRPVDLSDGPFPMVIILHGNHATCGFGSNPRVDDRIDYTTTGTCPDGWVVVPNHMGYGYVADRLASWGYIVVSINANRGITAGAGLPGDAGLNLARGRLILRHLQRLSEWNSFGNTPPSLGVELRGKLDFASVGLLGHSRGGEGVRAAYNLYRDAGSPWPARIPDPVNIQGIFEIGAVDGQTARVLNADGTIWNALLPMCDGDVSNLQGVRPFDRMIRVFDEQATQKSTYTVWGANHNFYNSEWQVSDSAGCLFHPALFPFDIGSPEQRLSGLAPMMAFFRGNVGPFADPTFNLNFNPLFGLPPVVTDITRVDRRFTASPNTSITGVFEDFERPTGINTYGVPNEANIVTITHGLVPRHDVNAQRAGAISWTAPGSDVYFQSNWTLPGEGVDVSGFQTLDVRVSRQHNPALNPNPNVPTDFWIQLVSADGTRSEPVLSSTYVDLRGPVGGAFAGNLHPILQTARIPLGDFGDTDLTLVRGVRLTFDSTPTGAIFVANIRLSTLLGSGADSDGTRSGIQTESSAPPEPPAGNVEAANSRSEQNVGNDRTVVVHNLGNVIRSIRTVASADSLKGQPGIEIELFSDSAFPVRDELLVLRIDDQDFVLGRYLAGETGTVIFALTHDEFDKTTTGDRVTIQYGRGVAPEEWDFGTLDKSILDQP